LWSRTCWPPPQSQSGSGRLGGHRFFRNLDDRQVRLTYIDAGYMIVNEARLQIANGFALTPAVE
jgi:hypothetical protein